jgi:hypothetical protein
MTPTSFASGLPAIGVVLLLGTVTLAGCLDKPKIEDRWTRVDVVSASVAPRQMLPPGATQAFTLHTTVTYRQVLTGFAVAELRASDSLGAAAMTVAPDAPRESMAQSIDDILQHSHSLGRATRAITGWDHLIQPIDFGFSATTPAAAGSRLFLLCYLGSGARLELPSGADSIVITPFVSSQHEVLPVGMELFVSGAGAP